MGYVSLFTKPFAYLFFLHSYFSYILDWDGFTHLPDSQPLPKWQDSFSL